MGNCLGYPPAIEADRRERLSSRQTSAANSLLGVQPVVRPFRNFSMNTRTPEEETVVKRTADTSFSMNNTSPLEIETQRISSANTSRASSFRRENRYIKRYRTEEEKLLDMLQEREVVIRSAIKQGQALRARSNRYKEELESLKALSDVDMTDLEWKKRYNELDKRNRDLKEEIDILTARNKNGRDHLTQQDRVIQQLNSELQHEKIEKQRLLSNSLTSLHSVGVKDKKGKLMITQLEVDNKLLQEQLNDLTVRNQRGRDYLSRLEAEKRDLDHMVVKLKSQMLHEKEDKDNLQTRLDILSSTQNLSIIETVPESSPYIYTEVQKKKTPSNANTKDNSFTHSANDETNEKQDTGSKHGESLTHNTNYEAVVEHRETLETDTKSTGFEIDDRETKEEVPQHEKRQDHMYEEVGFGKYNENTIEEPYITTYVMSSNPASGSGSITSTPRQVEDTSTKVVDEPIWDYIPESKEVDIEHVTTRF